MVVYWYKNFVSVNDTKTIDSYLENLYQKSKSQKRSKSEYLKLIFTAHEALRKSH